MVTFNKTRELFYTAPYRANIFFIGLLITVALLFSSSTKADLILNGSTIYSDLGKDQFVAALYTEIAHNNPEVILSMDSKKRMEVRILNNYSVRRWINLWMQSISINNSRENFSDSAEALLGLMQAPRSAPQKNDLLEYIFSPEGGTSMRYNGTELVSGLSGEVFNLLLRTWIGAIPPSASFKDEILGNQRNSAARDLIQSLSADKKRIALAASWILPKPSKTAKKSPAPATKEKPQQQADTEASRDLKLAAQQTREPAGAQQPASSPGAKAAKPQTSPTALDNTVAEVAKSENSAPAQAMLETVVEEKSEEDIQFNVTEALAQRDYTPLVVQKIYQNISYPSRAVSKNQEGTVRVAIKISRSGELQDVLTTQESKYSSLNKAALKAVKKAAPFPVLPKQISADSFELSIPITFRLQ